MANKYINISFMTFLTGMETKRTSLEASTPSMFMTFLTGMETRIPTKQRPFLETRL